MTLSALDMFKIGIGPSSSHTVGPMVAAGMFVRSLRDAGTLPSVSRVKVELLGSLGATGWGHGTMIAVVLGLAGEDPRTVDTNQVRTFYTAARDNGALTLLATEPEHAKMVTFHPSRDLVLNGHKQLPFHPNAMICTAWAGRERVAEETYYSVGGGFVLPDDGTGNPPVPTTEVSVPYPFRSATQLIHLCHDHQLRICDIALANEAGWRPEAETLAEIADIWRVMQGCVAAGVSTTGTLPGGLNVVRRAHRLHQKMLADGGRLRGEVDPLSAMDWVTLWALAVNEENAAGGRVVTAPTNGASGVIPAVLMYLVRFVPEVDDASAIEFLLTAAAIGSIFKTMASISGAEVGCQGEVGTASAMAAAGMAQVLGGTPQQVVNAAEIALEHHLGMTCDPVGGLVQIPCIERNAVGAIKAITAARLALNGDGRQHVTLDDCIRTMMQTGLDMMTKYKETATGGLAVNIVEC